MTIALPGHTSKWNEQVDVGVCTMSLANKVGDLTAGTVLATPNHPNGVSSSQVLLESFDVPNWPVEKKGTALRVTTSSGTCSDFEFHVQPAAGPVLTATPVVKPGSQCFADIQFVPLGPATMGVYAKNGTTALLPTQ